MVAKVTYTLMLDALHPVTTMVYAYSNNNTSAQSQLSRKEEDSLKVKKTLPHVAHK